MGDSLLHDVPESVGKYVFCGELAKGGMATIYLGHVEGDTTPVAIKRLSSHLETADLVTMFLDELEVAKRIRHPNIVPTIEVLSTDDELCLVMQYIEGETMSRLARAGREQGLDTPIAVAAGLLTGALRGLHAAHIATDANGRPLGIVHRDVSPQNIIVGVDGVPRVLDFGVAKAAVRVAQTRTGELKGKVAYMAPEQLDRSAIVGPRTDVYAAGIVFWEALTGRRLWDAESEGQLVVQVLRGASTPPSQVRSSISPALDAVVLRALAYDPNARFTSADEFADAIERVTRVAGPEEIAAWVKHVAAKVLETRARRIAAMMSESESGRSSVKASNKPARVAPTRTPTSPTLRGSSRTSESLTPATTPTEKVSSGATKGVQRHILIIDDSQVILDSARRALEAEGHRVTTTSQTVGAARHLVDADLVLIDFHMPGLDGGAVIQSFRAATKNSNRPCLFYLYSSDLDAAKDADRKGFDGVLIGKGNDDALVRGVRAALRVLSLRAMKK